MDRQERHSTSSQDNFVVLAQWQKDDEDGNADVPIEAWPGSQRSPYQGSVARSHSQGSDSDEISGTDEYNLFLSQDSGLTRIVHLEEARDVSTRSDDEHDVASSLLQLAQIGSTFSRIAIPKDDISPPTTPSRGRDKTPPVSEHDSSSGDSNSSSSQKTDQTPKKEIIIFSDTRYEYKDDGSRIKLPRAKPGGQASEPCKSEKTRSTERGFGHRRRSLKPLFTAESKATYKSAVGNESPTNVPPVVETEDGGEGTYLAEYRHKLYGKAYFSMSPPKVVRSLSTSSVTDDGQPGLVEDSSAAFTEQFDNDEAGDSPLDLTKSSASLGHLEKVENKDVSKENEERDIEISLSAEVERTEEILQKHVETHLDPPVIVPEKEIKLLDEHQDPLAREVVIDRIRESCSATLQEKQEVCETSRSHGDSASQKLEDESCDTSVLSKPESSENLADEVNSLKIKDADNKMDEAEKETVQDVVHEEHQDSSPQAKTTEKVMIRKDEMDFSVSGFSQNHNDGNMDVQSLNEADKDNEAKSLIGPKISATETSEDVEMSGTDTFAPEHNMEPATLSKSSPTSTVPVDYANPSVIDSNNENCNNQRTTDDSMLMEVTSRDKEGGSPIVTDDLKDDTLMFGNDSTPKEPELVSRDSINSRNQSDASLFTADQTGEDVTTIKENTMVVPLDEKPNSPKLQEGEDTKMDSIESEVEKSVSLDAECDVPAETSDDDLIEAGQSELTETDVKTDIQTETTEDFHEKNSGPDDPAQLHVVDKIPAKSVRNYEKETLEVYPNTESVVPAETITAAAAKQGLDNETEVRKETELPEGEPREIVLSARQEEQSSVSHLSSKVPTSPVKEVCNVSQELCVGENILVSGDDQALIHPGMKDVAAALNNEDKQIEKSNLASGDIYSNPQVVEDIQPADRGKSVPADSCQSSDRQITNLSSEKTPEAGIAGYSKQSTPVEQGPAQQVQEQYPNLRSKLSVEVSAVAVQPQHDISEYHKPSNPPQAYPLETLSTNTAQSTLYTEHQGEPEPETSYPTDILQSAMEGANIGPDDGLPPEMTGASQLQYQTGSSFEPMGRSSNQQYYQAYPHQAVHSAELYPVQQVQPTMMVRQRVAATAHPQMMLYMPENQQYANVPQARSQYAELHMPPQQYQSYSGHMSVNHYHGIQPGSPGMPQLSRNDGAQQRIQYSRSMPQTVTSRFPQLSSALSSQRHMAHHPERNVIHHEHTSYPTSHFPSVPVSGHEPAENQGQSGLPVSIAETGQQPVTYSAQQSHTYMNSNTAGLQSHFSPQFASHPSIRPVDLQVAPISPSLSIASPRMPQIGPSVSVMSPQMPTVNPPVSLMSTQMSPHSPPKPRMSQQISPNSPSVSVMPQQISPQSPPVSLMSTQLSPHSPPMSRMSQQLSPQIPAVSVMPQISSRSSVVSQQMSTTLPALSPQISLPVLSVPTQSSSSQYNTQLRSNQPMSQDVEPTGDADLAINGQSSLNPRKVNYGGLPLTDSTKKLDVCRSQGSTDDVQLPTNVPVIDAGSDAVHNNQQKSVTEERDPSIYHMPSLIDFNFPDPTAVSQKSHVDQMNQAVAEKKESLKPSNMPNSQVENEEVAGEGKLIQCPDKSETAITEVQTAPAVDLLKNEKCVETETKTHLESDKNLDSAENKVCESSSSDSYKDIEGTNAEDEPVAQDLCAKDSMVGHQQKDDLPFGDMCNKDIVDVVIENDSDGLYDASFKDDRSFDETGSPAESEKNSGTQASEGTASSPRSSLKSPVEICCEETGITTSKPSESNIVHGDSINVSSQDEYYSNQNEKSGCKGKSASFGNETNDKSPDQVGSDQDGDSNENFEEKNASSDEHANSIVKSTDDSSHGKESVTCGPQTEATPTPQLDDLPETEEIVQTIVNIAKFNMLAAGNLRKKDTNQESVGNSAGESEQSSLSKLSMKQAEHKYTGNPGSVPHLSNEVEEYSAVTVVDCSGTDDVLHKQTEFESVENEDKFSERNEKGTSVEDSDGLKQEENSQVTNLDGQKLKDSDTKDQNKSAFMQSLNLTTGQEKGTYINAEENISKENGSASHVDSESCKDETTPRKRKRAHLMLESEYNSDLPVKRRNRTVRDYKLLLALGKSYLDQPIIKTKPKTDFALPVKETFKLLELNPLPKKFDPVVMLVDCNSLMALYNDYSRTSSTSPLQVEEPHDQQSRDSLKEKTNWKEKVRARERLKRRQKYNEPETVVCDQNKERDVFSLTDDEFDEDKEGGGDKKNPFNVAHRIWNIPHGQQSRVTRSTSNEYSVTQQQDNKITIRRRSSLIGELSSPDNPKPRRHKEKVRSDAESLTIKDDVDNMSAISDVPCKVSDLTNEPVSESADIAFVDDNQPKSSTTSMDIGKPGRGRPRGRGRGRRKRGRGRGSIVLCEVRDTIISDETDMDFTIKASVIEAPAFESCLIETTEQEPEKLSELFTSAQTGASEVHSEQAHNRQNCASGVEDICDPEESFAIPESNTKIVSVHDDQNHESSTKTVDQGSSSLPLCRTETDNPGKENLDETVPGSCDCEKTSPSLKNPNFQKTASNVSESASFADKSEVLEMAVDVSVSKLVGNKDVTGSMDLSKVDDVSSREIVLERDTQSSDIDYGSQPDRKTERKSQKYRVSQGVLALKKQYITKIPKNYAIYKQTVAEAKNKVVQNMKSKKVSTMSRSIARYIKRQRTNLERTFFKGTENEVSLEQSELKNPQKSLVQNEQCSQELTLQRSSEKSGEEKPEKVKEKSPEKVRQKSPEKVRRKSPEKVRQKSLEKGRQNSPETTRQKSPENTRQKSPDKIKQKSPERHLESSPKPSSPPPVLAYLDDYPGPTSFSAELLKNIEEENQAAITLDYDVESLCFTVKGAYDDLPLLSPPGEPNVCEESEIPRLSPISRVLGKCIARGRPPYKSEKVKAGLVAAMTGRGRGRKGSKKLQKDATKRQTNMSKFKAADIRQVLTYYQAKFIVSRRTWTKQKLNEVEKNQKNSILPCKVDICKIQLKGKSITIKLPCPSIKATQIDRVKRIVRDLGLNIILDSDIRGQLPLKSFQEIQRMKGRKGTTKNPSLKGNSEVKHKASKETKGDKGPSNDDKGKSSKEPVPENHTIQESSHPDQALQNNPSPSNLTQARNLTDRTEDQNLSEKSNSEGNAMRVLSQSAAESTSQWPERTLVTENDSSKKLDQANINKRKDPTVSNETAKPVRQVKNSSSDDTQQIPNRMHERNRTGFFRTPRSAASNNPPSQHHRGPIDVFSFGDNPTTQDGDDKRKLFRSGEVKTFGMPRTHWPLAKRASALPANYAPRGQFHYMYQRTRPMSSSMISYSRGPYMSPVATRNSEEVTDKPKYAPTLHDEYEFDEGENRKSPIAQVHKKNPGSSRQVSWDTPLIVDENSGKKQTSTGGPQNRVSPVAHQTQFSPVARQSRVSPVARVSPAAQQILMPEEWKNKSAIEIMMEKKELILKAANKEPNKEPNKESNKESHKKSDSSSESTAAKATESEKVQATETDCPLKRKHKDGSASEFVKDQQSQSANRSNVTPILKKKPILKKTDSHPQERNIFDKFLSLTSEKSPLSKEKKVKIVLPDSEQVSDSTSSKVFEGSWIKRAKMLVPPKSKLDEAPAKDKKICNSVAAKSTEASSSQTPEISTKSSQPSEVACTTIDPAMIRPTSEMPMESHIVPPPTEYVIPPVRGRKRGRPRGSKSRGRIDIPVPVSNDKYFELFSTDYEHQPRPIKNLWTEVRQFSSLSATTRKQMKVESDVPNEKPAQGDQEDKGGYRTYSRRDKMEKRPDFWFTGDEPEDFIENEESNEEGESLKLLSFSKFEQENDIHHEPRSSENEDTEDILIRKVPGSPEKSLKSRQATVDWNRIIQARTVEQNLGATVPEAALSDREYRKRRRFSEESDGNVTASNEVTAIMGPENKATNLECIQPGEVKRWSNLSRLDEKVRALKEVIQVQEEEIKKWQAEKEKFTECEEPEGLSDTMVVQPNTEVAPEKDSKCFALNEVEHNVEKISEIEEKVPAKESPAGSPQNDEPSPLETTKETTEDDNLDGNQGNELPGETVKSTLCSDEADKTVEESSNAEGQMATTVEAEFDGDQSSSQSTKPSSPRNSESQVTYASSKDKANAGNTLQEDESEVPPAEFPKLLMSDISSGDEADSTDSEKMACSLKPASPAKVVNVAGTQELCEEEVKMPEEKEVNVGGTQELCQEEEKMPEEKEVNVAGTQELCQEEEKMPEEKEVNVGGTQELCQEEEKMPEEKYVNVAGTQELCQEEEKMPEETEGAETDLPAVAN